MATKAISFHSYKGGTGKTSIAANLAAIYARLGHRVCLLDYDFRAPSLSVLFKPNPKFWLNDYLNGRCEVEEALVDVGKGLGLEGAIFAGFADPSTRAIRDMMTKDRAWEMGALHRTLSAKRAIQRSLGADYLIFDTSPGIHYSSVNALASSDAIALVMKGDDFDMEGTKEMVRGIYDVLGRKAGIIMNKIPMGFVEGGGIVKGVEEELNIPALGVIPCYCELMAIGGRSIYALDRPDHPFSKALEDLSKRIAGM